MYGLVQINIDMNTNLQYMAGPLQALKSSKPVYCYSENSQSASERTETDLYTGRTLLEKYGSRFEWAGRKSRCLGWVNENIALQSYKPNLLTPICAFILELYFIFTGALQFSCCAYPAMRQQREEQRKNCTFRRT